MRRGLWTSIGFCGLLQAALIPVSVAAPIVPSEAPIAFSHNSLIEQVYYYHGRYYPYRYHGGYYAHRAYRHGYWRYY